MSPQCLYWITLLAVVLPSVPFNRMAIVVLLSWALGHFAHIFGPHEDAVYMFARISAFGAALGISRPWDGSRRAYAHLTVAGLFLPVAIMSFDSAVYFKEPAQTMSEYKVQAWLYWTTWSFIMAQAVIVPFGNDWSKIKTVLKQADDWLMGQIVKRFGDVL